MAIKLQVVFDAADPPALAAFWGEAIGYVQEDPPEGFDKELREHVGVKIGKLARPKRFIWAEDLPKTRSGKIMRRLLKDIASGQYPHSAAGEEEVQEGAEAEEGEVRQEEEKEAVTLTPRR